MLLQKKYPKVKSTISPQPKNGMVVPFLSSSLTQHSTNEEYFDIMMSLASSQSNGSLSTPSCNSTSHTKNLPETNLTNPILPKSTSSLSNTSQRLSSVSTSTHVLSPTVEMSSNSFSLQSSTDKLTNNTKNNNQNNSQIPTIPTLSNKKPLIIINSSSQPFSKSSPHLSSLNPPSSIISEQTSDIPSSSFSSKTSSNSIISYSSLNSEKTFNSTHDTSNPNSSVQVNPSSISFSHSSPFSDPKSNPNINQLSYSIPSHSVSTFPEKNPNITPLQVLQQVHPNPPQTQFQNPISLQNNNQPHHHHHHQQQQHQIYNLNPNQIPHQVLSQPPQYKQNQIDVKSNTKDVPHQLQSHQVLSQPPQYKQNQIDVKSNTKDVPHQLQSHQVLSQPPQYKQNQIDVKSNTNNVPHQLLSQPPQYNQNQIDVKSSYYSSQPPFNLAPFSDPSFLGYNQSPPLYLYNIPPQPQSTPISPFPSLYSIYQQNTQYPYNPHPPVINAPQRIPIPYPPSVNIDPAVLEQMFEEESIITNTPSPDDPPDHTLSFHQYPCPIPKSVSALVPPVTLEPFETSPEIAWKHCAEMLQYPPPSSSEAMNRYKQNVEYYKERETFKTLNPHRGHVLYSNLSIKNSIELDGASHPNSFEKLDLIDETDDSISVPPTATETVKSAKKISSSPSLPSQVSDKTKQTHVKINQNLGITGKKFASVSSPQGNFLAMK